MKKDKDYTHPDSLQPSLDEFYAAAEKAGVGDDALAWAQLQLTTFLELSRQRSRYQGGANALSLVDIQTYLSLNNLELHPIELHNILMLDHIFMNNIREQADEQYQRATKAQGAP